MSSDDDDGERDDDFLVLKFFQKCCVFVHFRDRPLPHFRTRPHWKPPGNPEYARNTLKFPRDEQSCKMGKLMMMMLLLVMMMIIIIIYFFNFFAQWCKMPKD